MGKIWFPMGDGGWEGGMGRAVSQIYDPAIEWMEEPLSWLRKDGHDADLDMRGGGGGVERWLENPVLSM